MVEPSICNNQQQTKKQRKKRDMEAMDEPKVFQGYHGRKGDFTRLFLGRKYPLLENIYCTI
jgi:hypothetical protein